MCTVSVIMPIYNSKKYLRESIESVIHQTYRDWELLAVNEYGSDDGSAEIIGEYEKIDHRIHLIQNSRRLGLAESLNRGFQAAKGKYLARLDADDLAWPERFEKQVQYLEAHPNVGICGTYQHHFGNHTDWIHKPPLTPAQCRAGLLFGCDLCHSTLMLRRKTVVENHLYYDNSYLAEDYELWTRALYVTDIANLPEVLGEYRIGEDNITNAKKEKLNTESGYIVAANLKRSLGYDLPEEQIWFFRGWDNPFLKYGRKDREKYYREFENVLRKIVKANRKVRFYEEKELLRVIDAKWRWAKYGAVWNEKREVASVDEIFQKNDKEAALKYLIKKVLRRPYYAVKYRTVDVILKQLWHMEGKTGRDIADLNSKMDKMEEKLHTAMAGNKKDMDQMINRLTETETKIQEVQKDIHQKIDERIWKAEEIIQQGVDGRIWKAEENIRQAMDGRIWKAEENIRQVMDGRIWKAEQSIIRMQEVLAELLLQFQNTKDKLIMINTPSHDNLGDHAIAYAEKCWVEENTSYHYIEISGEIYRTYRTVVKKFIRKEDLIAISGGGYIGSLWSHEEELVESVIADFPENRIRIFPQTVFFEENADKDLLHRAEMCFLNHSDFVLFVREQHSLDFMKQNLPACRCELAADMAFYLRAGGKSEDTVSADSFKAALCFKNDDEAILTNEEKNKIENLLSKAGFDVFVTDMLLDENLTDAGRRCGFIKNKIREFMQYDLLVTDRFHGAVFAFLAGVRCFVLPGKSYKNEGLCEMLGESSGVSYVLGAEEMEQCLVQQEKNVADRQKVLERMRKGIEKMQQYI